MLKCDTLFKIVDKHFIWQLMLPPSLTRESLLLLFNILHIRDRI